MAPDPPWPGVTLDLTPDPTHGELAVEVHVVGPVAAGVRQLRVARGWGGTRGAAAIVGPRARDQGGAVPLAPRADDRGPDEIIDLGRPVHGDLELRYRASATEGGAPFALHVSRDGMSGVGHAFLLLPRFDDAVPVRVRTHLAGLRRGADAASSFGFGVTVTTKASSEDLAHAVYVAGMLWRESGPERGGDDLVVLGDPPFDTQTAFERAKTARTAIDRFLRPTTATSGAAQGEPLHFVLVGQPGLGRAREGAYLTGSVGVWFDAKRALDGPLGLVIAHELAHRYLGGDVRLVDAEGHEAGWFAEGFTVHAARRAMLEAGLLSPGDFAADVNDALGSSPGADELPAEYRRGASFAAWLDSELARSSSRKVELRDLLLDLVARGGSLPVSALADAVRARAPKLALDTERAIAKLCAGQDAPVEVREDAFGACARRVVRERRDFGFDPRSLDLTPKLLRGVVAGSNAEAAGARDGALVLRAILPRSIDDARASDVHLRSSSTPPVIELVLADGRRIRYEAVVKRREVVWEPGDLDACRAELAQISR